LSASAKAMPEAKILISELLYEISARPFPMLHVAKRWS